MWNMNVINSNNNKKARILRILIKAHSKLNSATAAVYKLKASIILLLI